MTWVTTVSVSSEIYQMRMSFKKTTTTPRMIRRTKNQTGYKSTKLPFETLKFL